MKYVILPKVENSPQIYGRIDDDGLMRITCITEDPQLQKWIEEGNTPKTYKPE